MELEKSLEVRVMSYGIDVTNIITMQYKENVKSLYL